GNRHFDVDHLGSVRLITDDAKNVLSRHQYWAYGEEATSGSQDSEVMKFAGQERDFGTYYPDGLDYMHARYYDNRLSRFTTMDPLGGSPGAPQSWNRYGYVLGSPVTLVDPYGWAPGGDSGGSSATTGDDGCTMENGIFQCGSEVNGSDPGDDPWTGDWGFLTDAWQTAGQMIAAGRGIAREGKQVICKAVPSGRTTGASGGVGAIGSGVAGGEIVMNYDSGQVSAFTFGGLQLGWNGVASAQAYTGVVSGLRPDNANYSGIFVGGYGSAAVGIFGASSTDHSVKTGGASLGASLIESPTFGVNVTQYSSPLQIGRYWPFALSPVDAGLLVTRQLCK
ncbi:MAG: RHS repeat-associated core domain-containing protein, partial [Thermoanaerobaculia bacterium]